MDAPHTKVLVVDDDPDLRQLLADYLNRHGYDTLLAADANDLTERIVRYSADLLVLDRMLPAGDGADAAVLGVMNLRGVIVPIYDMRARFGQGMTDATATHVVIIVQVHDKTVGILVDAVSDILTVRHDQISPIPEVEYSENARFLEGMVTMNERMVAVMSLSKLIRSEALEFNDLTADAA